jgi:hypothetical protein
MANPQVLCTTSMGEFTCEIFMDSMPITSSNFLDLVRSPLEAAIAMGRRTKTESRRHPEALRMGLPTCGHFTINMLTPWVCFRRGGFPNPSM